MNKKTFTEAVYMLIPRKGKTPMMHVKQVIHYTDVLLQGRLSLLIQRYNPDKFYDDEEVKYQKHLKHKRDVYQKNKAKRAAKRVRRKDGHRESDKAG